MKLPLIAVLVLVGCQSARPEEPAIVFEGDPYGEELTLASLTPVADIVAAPEDWVGQRVLIEGTVKDVCDNAGCWMEIESGAAEIRVKVDDGVIVFPMSAKGRTALVEGVVERVDMTAEQARAAAERHAAEHGEPFDAEAEFTASTTYRIRGHGALIRG
jgi:hypothetical protein